MSEETQERTKLEALNGLRYEIRLHERHARFYRRVRKIFAFVALIGGASAFANVFTGTPILLAVGGLVVAACAFADIVWDYAAKASDHEAMRRRYLRVLAAAPMLTLDQLDARMARVAEDDPGHIESLRMPARNDTLRTLGYENLLRDLSPLERLMNLLA